MTSRIFNIEIGKPLQNAGTWPKGRARTSETLGGNRDYGDVGPIGWRQVREMIDSERAILAQLAARGDVEAAHRDWQENGEPSFDGGYLFNFDLGTNAVSAALKAARCLSFYSCNGGAFGDLHPEEYPVVCFYCREAILTIVEAAASQADVALELNHAGGLTASVAEIDAMIDFAEALHDRRTAVRSVQYQSTTPYRRQRGLEV